MSFSIPNPKPYILRLKEDTPYLQKRKCHISSLSTALAIACDRDKTKSKRVLTAIVRKLPLADRTDVARVVALRREKYTSFSACGFEFDMAKGAEAEKDGDPALAWWCYGVAPDTGNKFAYQRRTDRVEKAIAALLQYFDEKAYLSNLFKEIAWPHSFN